MDKSSTHNEIPKSYDAMLLEQTKRLRGELEDFLGIPYKEPLAGMGLIEDDLQATPGSRTKLATAYIARFAERAGWTIDAFLARGVEPKEGYDRDSFVRPLDGGDISMVWAQLVWMQTELERLQSL